VNINETVFHEFGDAPHDLSGRAPQRLNQLALTEGNPAVVVAVHFGQ
jgi:hypothetical protein